MNQEMKLETRMFKYIGGKGRMSEALVRCIPDSCSNYAEPFCGSAAVALATLKIDLDQRLLNDLNPYIATFWKVASDPQLGAELLEQLQATRHDRGAFEMALERRRAYGVNMDPVLMSRDTYLLIQQSFNGKATHWVVDGRATYKNNLEKLPALFEQIRGKFLVENMDAVDFMECHDLLNRPENFIFIDSPYLEGLRCDGALYEYDMPDAAEHIRLLRAIQHAQAKIIVSGYWSGSREEDLYDFYLCHQSPAWHRSLLGAYPKTCTGGKEKSVGLEWIWHNFEFPPEGIRMVQEYCAE